MKKQINYSDSERLTHYLDGELPESQAGDLLEKVAADGELQNQYHREQMINKTARMNGLITPPAFLKEQTMQKIGFAVKPPVTHAVKKYAWVLVALLFVAVTTTSVVFIKNQNDVKTSSNENLVANSSDKVTENIPVVTSNEIIENEEAIANNVDNNKTKTNITNSTNKNVKAKSNRAIIQDDIAEEATNTQNNEVIEVAEAIGNSDEQPVLAINLLSDKAPTNMGEMNCFDGANINITPEKQKSINFNPISTRCAIGCNELQIKGLNVYNANLMTQGNISIAYLRNWNAGLKIGLELSFENISKVTFDSETQIFGEPQELFSPTLSALARYDADRFTLYNVHPFAQVLGGFGMNANYVYGGGLGLEYSKLYLPVAFQLSYDYKAFNYYYGGTSNNSDFFTKHGFSLGINYKF